MPTTYSILAAQTPVTIDAGAGGVAITVGVRWYTETAGNVVGVRFYKGVTLGGTTHTVAIYSDAGTLLASKVSSGEADVTGWSNVTFDAALPVLANTAYKVATFWPTGHQPRTDNMFLAQLDNPPLHAYANGGRFNNVAGVLANPTSANNHCYFSDVLFQLPESVATTTGLSLPMMFVESESFKYIRTR